MPRRLIGHSETKVALGPLARSEMETHFGGDLAAGVKAALVHYTRRLRSARKPIDAPRADKIYEPSTAKTDLEFDLEAEIEEVLVCEGRRQNVSLDRLIAHAIFVYLADLDRY